MIDSLDNRERQYVGALLQRVYARFIPLRGFIRASVLSLFVEYVSMAEQHNGIAELLQLFDG